MPTQITKQTNQQGLASATYTAPDTAVDITAVIWVAVGSRTINFTISISGTDSRVVLSVPDLSLPSLIADEPTSIQSVDLTATDLALPGLTLESPTALTDQGFALPIPIEFTLASDGSLS